MDINQILLLGQVVGIITWGCIWGFITYTIMKNKGYDNTDTWFALGFFFGFFALLVAISKPQIIQRPNDSIPSHLSKVIEDEKQYKNYVSSDNGWYCNK